MKTTANTDTAVIGERVTGLAQHFRENPDAARITLPTATAVIDSGLAVRTDGPDDMSMVSDMPLAMGGQASAPSPGWLLLACVASCTATTIAMRAAQFGIDITRLQVAVSARVDIRGHLGVGDDVSPAIGDFAVDVRIAGADATDDELREITSWAVRHSPVSSTIRTPAQPTLRVETDG